MYKFDVEIDGKELLSRGIELLGRKAVMKAMEWPERRARNALTHLRSQAIADLTPEVEAAPEPTPAKTEKPEKPKPIRISKITEIDAALAPGIVHRYILSAAQDDTPVHPNFLTNLKAYARELGAEIKIAGFTYQKGLFEDHATATACYAPEIRDLMVYDRLRLSHDVLFVADANILPTAANPLTGWTTANGGRHVIIPHSRIALESIPHMQDQVSRYAITTGCCTIPSYAPRSAGRKAIQHHTYGAVLIEIDTDGTVFPVQLIADEDGNFQDMEFYVSNGIVTPNHRVASILWGDIHFEQLNQQIALASWGYDRKAQKFVDHPNLLDRLKPYYSIFEDTLDFHRRNHHNVDDPHFMALMAARGTVSIEEEIREAVAFANGTMRSWCQTAMAESNHDAAIAKWVKADHGRYDPYNARLWHRLNHDFHEAIEVGNDDFHVTEHAFRHLGLSPEIFFIRSGSSLVIQDVEHGNHGDKGINGARGGVAQFRRFGSDTSFGHGHAPCIKDGAWMAGVSANLLMGYNIGASTWAHAHIVLYPSGIRSMILMSADGRYRAVG